MNCPVCGRFMRRWPRPGLFDEDEGWRCIYVYRDDDGMLVHE